MRLANMHAGCWMLDAVWCGLAGGDRRASAVRREEEEESEGERRVGGRRRREEERDCRGKVIGSRKGKVR
jgi:hypothetical protein